MSLSLQKRLRQGPNPYHRALFSSPAAGEGDDVVVIPFRTKVSNIVLASALFSFCGGVMWYSAYAVGRSGNSSGSDSSSSEDPLAVLKQEASVARVKHEKDQQTTQDATSMLQQFQSGEFDPDKYEDEAELDRSKKANGKPWYKFW
jgi:hypothetical protein